ncbi:MAG: hypothetical protein CMJ90_15860 [Planctomycetes bacterium]|nr:hypothetical protein [Planctomycetota bacterium]
MPSKLITLVALALLANVGVAQWTDDFESHATGYLCYQDPSLVPGAPCALGSVGNSGGWDGWFNNPIEAGIVVNAPGLGSNGSDQYLDISPALGCQDAVHPWKENATTGAGAASGATYTTYPTTGGWTVACDFQVPVGGTALGATYFILLNDYNAAGTSTAWSAQCPFTADPANPGMFQVNDDLDPGPAVGGFSEGVWYRIRMDICLNANAASIYIDDAGADGVLGTMDDVATTLTSGRVYAGGGPVEIANLDLFSAGGQLYYDNCSLTPTGCPVYPYQFDQPGVASMDMDGTPINVFTGIGHAFGYGAGVANPAGSNHSITLDGNFANGDIAVVPAPEIDGPSNPLGAIFSANSLNVNILTPGTSYIFGGAAPSLAGPVPPLSLAIGGSVIGALGGGASTVSSQLAVINPASSDGFSLSRAVAIDLITAVGYIEPSTATVDIEGFEASGGWVLGGPGAALYGANWQSAVTATGQFSVHTGGTGSGGTGATAALEGSQYIYTEVSGGASANIFELEMIAGVLPVAAGNVFYGAHLEGVNTGIGELLEEDPANPGTWTVIDTVAGPLGGGWNVRSPALIHGGGSVRLMIRYSGATGWSGDFCVDRMAIGL